MVETTVFTVEQLRDEIITSPTLFNELAEAMSKEAHDVCIEYGLPVHDEGGLARIKLVFLAWLQTEINRRF